MPTAPPAMIAPLPFLLKEDAHLAPALASKSCVASVYWEGFNRPLADGRRHSPDDVLVAHKSLPLGTSVRITSLTSNRAIVAPVADRGPFVRRRCVDLSRGAAKRLGLSSLDRVTVEVINP